MSDVLIVGAGPIGLTYAWGLKILNPNLKVTVLEKYSEYQRKHTLVMEPAPLEALMKATGTINHPVLKKLLQDLKKDKHIRTNQLESIFKKLAIDNGVEIVIESFKKETAEAQCEKYAPKLKLLIGADGTHSTISQRYFPPDNQIKHEFDYVLQCRYEIEGDKKALPIDGVEFYEEMTRFGLIANEYIGQFSEGKTPVTMQMMISKAAYETLKEATSKDPYYPYKEQGIEREKLPKNIRDFITKYFELKIQSFSDKVIDKNLIRISVNEAPATHAQAIVKDLGEANVLLVGDAALGLSYFKGLNAGIEAAGQFFKKLKPSIQNNNTAEFNSTLDLHQKWFIEEFSPKKVKEVSNYSTWRIRAAMKMVKATRFIKSSVFQGPEPNSVLVQNYFNYLAPLPAHETMEAKESLYPHRPYGLIRIGQLSNVPIKHHFVKIKKGFVDYCKPYKGFYQLGQDFKQPLMGLNHIALAFGNFFRGVFSFKFSRCFEAFVSIFRGLIELATTPFAWIIKPCIRGIFTLIKGFQKIEKNHGIQFLVEKGIKDLETCDLNSQKAIYAILAISNDIHRKFEKQIRRNQKTEVQMKEHIAFSDLKTTPVFDKQKLENYFNLFKSKEEMVSTKKLSVNNAM